LERGVTVVVGNASGEMVAVVFGIAVVIREQGLLSVDSSELLTLLTY
jgi:hypothetical protein